jgi:Fur family ferric uptake transcriptional regulator
VTTTHRRPAVAAKTVEEAINVLRGFDLRASTARRLVLEVLFAADGPVSADVVAEGLEGRWPGADLASVYRNLEMLEEVGLVRHVHLGHGPGLYALASPEREYLVCESCRSIRPVATEELEEVRDLVRKRFGFEARFVHFPLAGLCPDCMAKGDDREKGQHAHS